MEVVAGFCDAIGVFAWRELCEVGFVAGAKFEGDASPVVLCVGGLHKLDVALEVWVDMAGCRDF